MFTKSFHGGVHPKDKKGMTKFSPIRQLQPIGDLNFLMNQHIGAPAKPIVSVGDYVKKGQIIAEAGGFVSANICSSVSGTVKKIGAHMCQNGENALCISVENDRKYNTIDRYGVYRDFNSLSKEEIIKIIKDAGIVGMGGAGFPTHVKLSPKNPDAIDYILCNGAECEPYITCDYRLMLERPILAVTGMQIILKLFPNAKGIFGIENNKPLGISSVENAIKSVQQKNKISVVKLRRKYPQGGERMLIYSITKRKINSKMLPADAGCIVLNFSTLIAIADAVVYSKPLTSRVITVTGRAVSNPSNFEIPIGMDLNEVVSSAGEVLEFPKKIIFGGPMMGSAVYTLSLPAIKTSSCIVMSTKDQQAQYHPQECIRCGKCLTVCPERLMPIKLKNSADIKDYETFERLNGLECIGCGSCTYICPSRRRLSQSITSAKQFIIAEKKKGSVK